MLDGVEIASEDKVKGEALHGSDVNDKQVIFKSLLPQENFVDRRVHVTNMLDPESDDCEDENSTSNLVASEQQSGKSLNVGTGTLEYGSTLSLAQKYVGEMIQRVEY